MKKALFALLAAMLLAGCPTDDNTETPGAPVPETPGAPEPEPVPETRTFWRAVKIGEIDEPLIDDYYNWFTYFNLPRIYVSGYDYSTDIASRPNSESNRIRSSAANYWLTKNRAALEAEYGEKVYINTEQPRDWEVPAPYTPEEYFSVVEMNHQWKVGSLMYTFIPDYGAGYMQWAYNSANNPFFSSDVTAADGYSHIYIGMQRCLVITANIYRWTEVTE